MAGDRLGAGVRAQTGGQILRLVSESRVRNDPGLMQLGPDPLARTSIPRRRRDACARWARAARSAMPCWTSGSSPGSATRSGSRRCSGHASAPGARWTTSTLEEAEDVIRENERVMQVSVKRGRRPRSIYRGTREPCPRCGGRIRSRGQGDANRMAYWCPGARRSLGPPWGIASRPKGEGWPPTTSACSSACRCSRSSRRTSWTASPPWRCLAASREGSASSTRATPPTRATSSAAATCGSPASTRTAARSRWRRSPPATSSASSRCWTAAPARRAWRRWPTPSCWRCRRRRHAAAARRSTRTSR